MIITDKHKNAANIVAFDCRTKRLIKNIKSFDTISKLCIMCDTQEITNKDGMIINKIKIDIENNAPSLKEEYLPNLILINCKTKEIIK